MHARSLTQGNMSWKPKGSLAGLEQAKQASPKKTELLFESQLMNMRNSPLPISFLLPKNGKKYMDVKTTRGLQSKISLKFPLSADLVEKAKMAPTVKQSIIDDFEKAYKFNCN